ncbi:MAG: GNAT family N-acetyltransferase [Victivallaceae bacterium]|nr:GNAT family N-acetyltransferase [Victivallaceae bacterium]
MAKIETILGTPPTAKREYPSLDSLPDILAEERNFLVKIASTSEEIAAAQHLRFRVFHEEQNQLSSLSEGEALDCDCYDAQFRHILVIDRDWDRVVGTYRICSGALARRGRGFYSESEFDFPDLARIASATLEVGRSCVDAQYRSGTVIALLWSGIAAVWRHTHADYVIGCVSLEHTDGEIGWAIAEHLRRTGRSCREFAIKPKDAFRLPPVQKLRRVEDLLADPASLNAQLPPLFKGYLRLGATIALPPALDRAFGSIDYLVILRRSDVPERYARHFHLIE